MIDLGVPMSQIILAAEQTVYMVFVSLFLGTILAIIMSVVLVLTNDDGILKNKYVYTVLNTVINIIRSIPFIILMVFILPLTKMIVGTRIGTTAALVPLVIFIAPYLTRLLKIPFWKSARGSWKRRSPWERLILKSFGIFCFLKLKALLFYRLRLGLSALSERQLWLVSLGPVASVT